MRAFLKTRLSSSLDRLPGSGGRGLVRAAAWRAGQGLRPGCSAMTDRGARHHGIGTAPDESHDESRTEAHQQDAIRSDLSLLCLIYSICGRSMLIRIHCATISIDFISLYFLCPYSVQLVPSWHCDNSWFVSGLTWSVSRIITKAIWILIYIRGEATCVRIQIR